jgi:hypothetical protein
MPLHLYADAQVRPYNATEVQAALQYAMQHLPSLYLQQLSNIAGALAAAGHLDPAFMQELGDAAAAKIKAQPHVVDQAGGLRAFRTLCWLAVGFSRLGVLHPELMEQIALYGEAADRAGVWVRRRACHITHRTLCMCHRADVMC